MSHCTISTHDSPVINIWFKSNMLTINLHYLRLLSNVTLIKLLQMVTHFYLDCKQTVNVQICFAKDWVIWHFSFIKSIRKYYIVEYNKLNKHTYLTYVI